MFTGLAEQTGTTTIPANVDKPYKTYFGKMQVPRMSTLIEQVATTTSLTYEAANYSRIKEQGLMRESL